MSLSTVATQKKYGLIKKNAPKTLAARPKLKAFDDSAFDDDDDEDKEDEGGNVKGNGSASSSSSKIDVRTVNRQLQRNAQKQLSALESDANKAAATEDGDASIFDYDGAYDSFKAQEVKSHPLSQPAADEPKSRYVSSLLSTAKMREKDKERIFERRQLKERKEEEKEFGDQPKFLTAAYKKKLMEDKKWEYEDQLADALEQRTDVRQQGMSGFYKNLLTKNVALGGNVANAVSIYTAGSSRQNQLLSDDTNTATAVAATATSVAGSSRGSSSRDAAVATEADENSSRMTDTQRRTEPIDVAELDDRSGSSSSSSSSYVLDSKLASHAQQRTDLSAIVPAKASATSVAETAVVTPAATSVEATSALLEATAAPPTAAVEQAVNRIEQVLTARERYLARKRAAEQLTNSDTAGDTKRPAF